MSEPDTSACRLCGNLSGNRHFSAREMMLGLRDEFDYIQCAQCAACQIAVSDAMDAVAGVAVAGVFVGAVILRESGVSSTPRLLNLSLMLWNTGSPAFAGDDSC